MELVEWKSVFNPQSPFQNYFYYQLKYGFKKRQMTSIYGKLKYTFIFYCNLYVMYLKIYM